MTNEQTIIDRVMPTYDVMIAEHRVVYAEPQDMLAAAKSLDFMTVHSPLLDVAMWVRGLPDRLRRRTQPPPARLVLADGDSLPGWLTLGSSAEEVAFGAVGKFWQRSIEWRDVRPDEFATFAAPGWGKIACDFSVRPYGEGRTLLSYECRTVTADGESRRRFAQYWSVIRPFVAHIMRATLKTIAHNSQDMQNATQPASAGAEPDKPA